MKALKTLILTKEEEKILSNFFDTVTMEFYEEIDFYSLLNSISKRSCNFTDGSQNIIIEYENVK